jgi:hypothetical protein
LTCEQCKQDVMGLVIYQRQVLCRPCCALAKGETNRATAVLGDDIPGGFTQENFGHTPEVFYSKKAMLKRAAELGLQPFVRHVDGDKHTSRWV